MLLFFSALLFFSQVEGQCLVQCAQLHRVGCPQTPDAVCGSCFLNYTGTLSGNTNCTAILPCVALQTCKGHGVCRSDQSCGCDPEWYGADCSQPIGAGSWTDVNLAGVIIAWLLIVPVLIGLTAYCIKAQQEGKLDDWKDSIAERMPTFSLPTRSKQPSNGTEMTTAQETHIGITRPAPAAHRGGSAEPKNINELVKYVQEVLPSMDNETVKQELKKHDYNAAETVNALL